MKHLIALCLLAAIATATATELRSVRFDPATGAISLTISADGFSRSQVVKSGDLAAEQQAAIAAVMG